MSDKIKHASNKRHAADAQSGSLLPATAIAPPMPSVMVLRIMTEEINKRHRFYQAAAIIGGLGAFGQAVLLCHQLADTYPYKMMSFPPGSFYASIGYTGLVVAPALAILVLFALKLRQLWLAPMVPVILCPAFFWGVYKAAFLIRGMRGNVAEGRNFDDTTPAMVDGEFTSYTVSLGLKGLGVGLACGLVLWLLLKSKPNVYR